MITLGGDVRPTRIPKTPTEAPERQDRNAHSLERRVGIEHYVSDAEGTGGRLRDAPEDFRVREVEAMDAVQVDDDTGAYPHLVFRAELRNWETNDFASKLSDRLGISRERVSWAGTIDMRAVTTRLFSALGVAAGDLPERRHGHRGHRSRRPPDSLRHLAGTPSR